MPRTFTGPQRTQLGAAGYNIHVKALVEDSLGAMIDFSTLSGINWFDSAKWKDSIDSPTMDGTIAFVREAGALSLAPLMTLSALNAGGAAIDGARKLQILTAFVAPGVTPGGGDWIEVFQGMLANPDWGGRDAGLVTCVMRDTGAWLMQLQIDTPRVYGSSGGTAYETVLQDILDDNIHPKLGALTLYTPTSPATYLREFTVDANQPVLTALRNIAQKIGWDIKFRYDAAGAFRLTFFVNDRSKTTPDFTFGPGEYFEINTLELPTDDVRNIVWTDFVDHVTGLADTSKLSDAPSITAYGPGFMRLSEEASSNIDSMAEANALGGAALSDLKLPYATQLATHSFFWPAQTGDLNRYLANAVTNDVSIDLAVVEINHSLANGEGETSLLCRAKVAGFYRTWLAIEGGAVPLPTTPSLQVTATASPNLYSLIYTTGGGSLLLSIDNGPFAAAPASPITVQRPAPGSPPLIYTFELALGGQTISNTVSVEARADPRGAEVISNPSFRNGLVGYNEYDNLASGHVHFSLQTDAAAPNASGKFLRINVDAATTPWTTVDPGFGGFYLGLLPDSGDRALDKYHRGAHLLFRVRANIPVGYTINYGSNPYGTGGTATWLTSQAGTGAYFDYVLAVVIGTAGTFSSIGFFYLLGPGTGPIQWDVAMCDVLDENQPPTDTKTPDLVVTPSAPTTTTQDFTASATSPDGGTPPAIYATVRGTTGSFGGGPTAMADGTEYLVSANGAAVVVTPNRPPFGTTAQASVTFRAVLAAGGQEIIQRSISNQVKTSFGPSLDVTATPGPTSYSIAYVAGSGTVELSINGAAYGTAPASPIVVTRPSAGSASLDYAFRLTVDGQTVTNSVTVPAIDKDTVTPNLTVVPSAPTATTQDFSVSATNPSGGTAPDIYAVIRGSTGTYGPGTPMADGTEYLISAGGGITAVTPLRPAFGTAAQASVSFRAVIAGGGQETIQRSILTQVKTTFGPSLDVRSTPGSTSDSIAYVAGSGTVELSIDGGSFSTAPASPIVVTRPAAGSPAHVYSFRLTVDGQTTVESITVNAIDQDTITPDIAVVPGADATTTKPFTVTATNPSGGAAPTITVTPVGCSMVIAGTTYTTPQTVASGTVVTANRPAFGATVQASLTFVASLSGAGSATIQRTVLNQVKTSFGPSLVATPSADATSVTIEYTATGTVELSIDGGTYSSAPASPIIVTRNGPGGAVQTYTLKASADGQEVSTTIQIDPQDSGASTAPSITNIQCFNSFYPNDGGGSFDVSWDANNLPGGCTFDLSCNITAGYFGGPNPVTRSGITSPATISNPPGPGPEFSSLPSGNVTITAKLDGTVICTGAFSGTFS